MTSQAFIINDWKDSGISDEVILANQALVEQSAILMLKKWFANFIDSFPTHSLVPSVLRGCRYSRGRTIVSFPDGEKKEVLVFKVSVRSVDQMEKVLLVRQHIIARLQEIDEIEIIFICCEPIENGQAVRATKYFTIFLSTGLEYNVLFAEKKKAE